MCGIVGVINIKGNKVKESQITDMSNAILHRGPDDGGVWCQDNVGLGSRRLAIIDLSPSGHMPMTYDRGSLIIVYNGEIYNYQELKKKLIRLGYKFKSQSDTEVILALYHKYHEKCLQYLRGMFSFAIYDRKRKTLFAARDRLGKKPFKYYLDEDKFIFASELKSILTQGVKKVLDYQAIWDYLTYQYIPFPLTGFKRIYKLPPGYYLFFKDGKLEIRKYWDLDPSQKLKLSENEWKERIISELDESVKLRMISDVPLGAFLSGGVDSSAVVASMALQSKNPVKTFSIGFKENSFNELPFAKIVAKQYHTNHTEFIVNADAANILPSLVNAFEEPFADSSALPSYYLSKLTRQHVTVALNGDGGDENFAGYPWYFFINMASSLYKLPKVFRQSVVPFAILAYKMFPNTTTYRGTKFARSLGEDLSMGYVRYMEYFSDEQKELLTSSNFKDRVASPNSRKIQASFFDQYPDSSVIDRASYSDIKTYLAGDLIPKIDIATMINSLEGRSPLLDHKFMEMSATIPTELKVKKGVGKYIFKKALEGRLPAEILYRSKKGFSIPVAKWFRGELKEMLSSQLLEGRISRAGLLNQKELKSILDSHLTTPTDHSQRLWALLTLSLWLEEYKPSLS